MDECRFEACTRRVNARGLCSGHYGQERRGVELRTLRVVRTKHAVALRDSQGNKICITCNRWLPEDRFTGNRITTDRLQATCRECSRDDTRLRYYHLTPDAFNAIFAAQGNACALCDSTVPGGTGWHIDHDHGCCPGLRSCGKCVRGVLCHSCNLGLGAFRDDVNRLARAVAYLRQSD